MFLLIIDCLCKRIFGINKMIYSNIESQIKLIYFIYQQMLAKDIILI